MSSTDIKLNRNYGYDILINTFEPFLREYIINVIFIPNYGNEWRNQIPKGVFNQLEKRIEEPLEDDVNIDDFFEELSFLNLKDILIFSSNFSEANSLVGSMSKTVFIERMDKLNKLRRKVAHPRSTFSKIDLLNIIDHIQLLCQNKDGKEINLYLDNREYENAKDIEIPLSFFEEYDTTNNLPIELHDLDGGFVGREKEIETISKLLVSQQDRIITITGAGGVGKSAIALKVTYDFMENSDDFYDAYLWFSAKETELKDEGIVKFKPGITNYEQLLLDMTKILDIDKFTEYTSKKVDLTEYRVFLNDFYENHQCLIVIDNLETIIEDDDLITFIKDIPRPSQVLITSRKGLGEIERRYPLKDMLEKDAIHLFKLVARERNLSEIAELDNKVVLNLVRSVRCYPLLVKWSLGQVALGVEIEKAFSTITSGDSEIAIFSFNDVFVLLSKSARMVLYSMIVAGDRPLSKYLLRTLANVTEDQIDSAIRELTLTSFIYQVPKEIENRVITEYTMLELTRGFVQAKLDEEKSTIEILQTRYYDLSDQIKDLEKSKSSYAQSLISMGINSMDEKVAFNYVKTAKNYELKNEIKNAEKYYLLALEAAPNLSYVLTEYSKFEYSRKHHHNSIKLSKQAVDSNPESFHAWLNFGTLHKQMRVIDQAIYGLNKAKKLNSSYLPVYTHLGQTYMYNGQYEKAEKEFKQALRKEKYPNYRHKFITLKFRANNFSRWSREFQERDDRTGQMEKITLAKETIDEALKISYKDYRIWKLYRDIYLEYGIIICQMKGYKKGKEFLLKSIETKTAGRKYIKPSGEEEARAYFYLAVFAKKEAIEDKKTVLNYVTKGLHKCSKKSKWYTKLNNLYKEVDGAAFPEEKRLIGRIKFYNYNREFGIIIHENQNHIFFRDHVVDKEFLEKNNLAGKVVSFGLIDNVERYKEKNPKLAVNIEFEDD